MNKINKLYMHIKGLETKTKMNKNNEEEHYTQLQTYIIKNEKLVKHTLKLNRLISKEEEQELLYSYIYADNINNNLKEYQIDPYTKTYSCDSVKLIKKFHNEEVFIFNKEIAMEIHNIKRQEQTKKDKTTNQNYLEVSYTFQCLEQINNSIRIIDIKVITDNLNKEDYINKKVLFKDINEMKINNKTYYRTNTTPQILENEQ